MRKFICSLALVLVLCSQAVAGGVDCPSTPNLMSATISTATTTNGTMIAVPQKPLLTAVALASCTGSTPTLDIKLQFCLTTNTASCYDSGIAFDQCTGTCWTDGAQIIDLGTANLANYVRAVAVTGGTPNCPVSVYLCSGGR